MGLLTVRGKVISFFTLLTSRRNRPILHQQKRLSNPHEMDTNTTNIFKRMTVAGPENTANPRYSSRAPSSDPTLPGYHLPVESVAR
jgi:hypothetical protein